MNGGSTEWLRGWQDWVAGPEVKREGEMEAVTRDYFQYQECCGHSWVVKEFTRHKGVEVRKFI